MAKITFLILSFALLLSIHSVVGDDGKIKDFGRPEISTNGDASITVDGTTSDQAKKTDAVPDIALSPKHEGRFFSTMFFTPMLEMADVGLITTDDAKKVASSPDVQTRLAKFIEEAKFSSKDNIDVVMSPDEEERYLSTMFFSPLMRMADDGLLAPDVLRKVVSSSEAKSKLAQFIEKARTSARDGDGPLSPEQEEQFFSTIFFTPMMEMVNAGFLSRDTMQKMAASPDTTTALSEYIAKAKAKYNNRVTLSPVQEEIDYEIMLFAPFMKMAEAGVISPEIVSKIVSSPVTKTILSNFVSTAKADFNAEVEKEGEAVKEG